MESQIQTPLAPAPKKKRRFWRIFTYVISGLALLLAGYIGGSIAYFNLAFDYPVFVNGASMYPFFNKDAERLEGRKYRPYSFDDGNSLDGDILDFGFAKSRNSIDVAKEVQRYNVVATYYPSDYRQYADGSFRRDANGKLILLENSHPKIKRVIGLPGESVTYRVLKNQTEENENANLIWGETKVTKDGKTEILKPLYTTADYNIGDKTYHYPYKDYSWASSTSQFTLDLKADEYLVAGDNRGYSSDGISGRFAITAEMIQAKVYWIVGKTKMHVTAKGNEIDGNHAFVFSPWNFRRVG